MKYIRQVGIILFLSLIGEIIHLFIHIPIPASIYGLIILFIGLKTKRIPLEAVEDVSLFLIEIMPLMFIPAAVGLLDSWGKLKPILIPFVIITFFSTIIVMGMTGKVTQFFIIFDQKRKAKRNEQCN